MSRVIYGYSGEGSGHSSRTREMASHLIEQGHKVHLVSYDRGYKNLCDDFNVLEIEGLTISSDDNRVSVLATVAENVKRLPKGARALGKLRDLFRQFRPDVVVCDFEPMTAYLAEHYRVPLISLDNQHRMRYMEYDVPPGQESAAVFTRRLIRTIVPWPGVSLITSFVDGPVRNDRSFVFPPIVRSAVRNLIPTHEGHFLVYLTSGFDSLIDVLQTFPREEFHVFGYDRDDRSGNIQFHRPGQQTFLAQLASARGVIATAGFTLISEALYFRKPYLAMPMFGQFEQELNAWQLQQAGLGIAAPQPTSESIGNFIYRIPELEERLAGRAADDGLLIKQKLEELVANNGRIAREFRQRREV